LTPVAADVSASFISSPLETTDLSAADSITAVAMPEPSSLILLASGLAVAARKLRQRHGRSVRDER
jgi:hypothetical protein